MYPGATGVSRARKARCRGILAYSSPNIWRVTGLLLLAATCALSEENVATIIQRSVEANNRDWNAAPRFDYSERDKDGNGNKTYAVTMLYGSPYERLIEINGQRLSPEKDREEQRKYENAVAERRNESADKRAARISKYEAERKRDRTLTDQLAKAFEFKLTGEQEIKGRKVYVLKATPLKNYRPPNRDSRVLTGMEGTMWIDKETYQWVKVEAHVTRPVRIEGFLAEVEPGTQFELEKIPVSPDVWLATHFAMKANARIMKLFPHRSQEEVSYFDYHKGSESSGGKSSAAAK